MGVTDRTIQPGETRLKIRKECGDLVASMVVKDIQAKADALYLDCRIYNRIDRKHSMEFFGRTIYPRRVIHATLQGPTPIVGRFQAWMAHMEATDWNVKVLPGG